MYINIWLTVLIDLDYSILINFVIFVHPTEMISQTYEDIVFRWARSTTNQLSTDLKLTQSEISELKDT